MQGTRSESTPVSYYRKTAPEVFCVSLRLAPEIGYKFLKKDTEVGQQDDGWPKAQNYDERLYNLGVFSLRRRRTRSDLIETFKTVRGLSEIKVSNCSLLYQTKVPESIV